LPDEITGTQYQEHFFIYALKNLYDFVSKHTIKL
jgi:hypothetical protein